MKTTVRLAGSAYLSKLTALIASLALLTVVLSGCFFAFNDRNAIMKQFLSDANNPSLTFFQAGKATILKDLEGTPYQQPQSLIYQTDRLQQPMPTNDWWSSAAWMPFTGAMYPHPLSAKAYPSGFGIAYPDNRPRTDAYHYLYTDQNKDMLVGGQGLNADAALVDGFGDWSVDLLFAADEDPAIHMRATLAHGSPFVYFTFKHTAPLLTFSEKPTIIAGALDDAILAISVQGNSYGIFAPSGTTWTELSDTELLANLPEGSDYLSVAILPDEQIDTLHVFQAYAYNFITDTRVSWRYQQADSTVTAEYKVITARKEGQARGTLFALYPHQWKHTNHELLPFDYRSPRGRMKLLAGQSFETTMVYRGILPYLPNIGVEQAKLSEFLDVFMTDLPLVKPGSGGEGTYWTGKNYYRLSQAANIASQAGDAEAASILQDAIMKDMERFLQSQEHSPLISYDDNWGTLNIHPTQFGADLVLNDHHFHYGYWVHASALLAVQNPRWAKQEEYGGIIELLIRDYANWEREGAGAKLFPFLRTFDPYAGHSWASGPAADGTGYSPGNNQESSSEAIHASAAMILWGEATGNPAIRDAGIYMYTTEVEAIRNYWFDVEGDNLPVDYLPEYAPIVFSSGAEYRTWWTNNPEEIHGINYLPMTPASLYLSWDKDYARANYERMKLRNGSEEQEWKDITWMYEALFDPSSALSKFMSAEAELTPEYGESHLHIYQWIAAMDTLGGIDTEAIANTPLYAVFRNGNQRTYTAYNSTNRKLTVTFKTLDGEILHTMKVEPTSIHYEQKADR
jgi:endoglucanase Acf2